MVCSLSHITKLPQGPFCLKMICIPSRFVDSCLGIELKSRNHFPSEFASFLLTSAFLIRSGNGIILAHLRLIWFFLTLTLKAWGFLSLLLKLYRFIEVSLKVDQAAFILPFPILSEPFELEAKIFVELWEWLFFYLFNYYVQIKLTFSFKSNLLITILDSSLGCSLSKLLFSNFFM